FGVVKHHFHLMVAAPEYSLEVQSKVILALCVLHNFIHIHDPDDHMDRDELERRDLGLSQRAPVRMAADFGHSISVEESNQAERRREEIAKAMWTQYQNYQQS
ncbi:hypothetical protein BDQ17DRAFT_1194606, partial [Cyathus striatus]